jgi:hypothetical protein
MSCLLIIEDVEDVVDRFDWFDVVVEDSACLYFCIEALVGLGLAFRQYRLN